MVLIDTLAAGGAERVAVDFVCGLDRRRFAPHVVVTRSTGLLRQMLDAAGIPVTELNRRRRISLTAYRRARAIAQDSDLIHAHKFTSNAWGALLARTTGKPLIAHEHNWSATQSAWQSFINRRWIAPMASSFLCVSDTVAEEVRRNGVQENKVHVLRNAVRLNVSMSRAAARDELGLRQTAFVIGIIARLRPEKNHQMLLRATARLIADDHDLAVCIVGDGAQRNHLEHMAEGLGVAGHIIWTGERGDAGKLAAAFDVAVLCSAWEGLPLAALEAMAAEIPVVATSVGGLPDLLADGAGVLVPLDDDAALAGAIVDLRANPHTAAAIGRAGCRRVHEFYNLTSIVAELEHIYSDATARAEVATK
jgi:glycosyltransferase involved in cell wall biosynthesis